MTKLLAIIPLLFAQVINTGSYRKVFLSGPTCSDAFAYIGALNSGLWTQSSAAGYAPLAAASGVVIPTLSTVGLATCTGGTITSGGSQSAETTLPANWAAASGSGLTVLNDSAGNLYLWFLANASVNTLGTAGLTTVIARCPVTNTGDTIKLSVNGSTHTFTCLNVTSGLSSTGTDTSYTTGYPGVRVAAGTSLGPFVGTQP